ncbi:MAG: hypothetical protein K2X86_05650 [Cytophagaceae bacterium]|nr:hypothetical protein [Cytophagaceae bacterium]
MYERDYILKLAQLFAKLLSKLMGLKEKGDYEKALELIDEAYKELFQLSSGEIIRIDSAQWIEFIKNQKLLKPDRLDILAHLIKTEGDFNSGQKAHYLYLKSLALLEYLNKEQKIYSFEREALIKEIKNKLNT